MKKIYILFPVSLVSVALGLSLASASAGFVATIQGTRLTTISASDEIRLAGNESSDYKNIDANTDTENQTRNSSTSSSKNDDNDDSDNDDGIANGSVNSNINSNFKIDGEQERSKENRGFFISEVAQVNSGDDLRLFVLSLVNKNKDITDVTIEEDSISVTRNIETKLFGFIPSSIKEKTLVAIWDDGTEHVSVVRPWWSIFSEDGIVTGDMSADIESRVKNVPTIPFKATLDTKTKAYILSEIQAAFIANAATSSTFTKVK